jgi:hypothetical protein
MYKYSMAFLFLLLILLPQNCLSMYDNNNEGKRDREREIENKKWKKGDHKRNMAKIGY